MINRDKTELSSTAYIFDIDGVLTDPQAKCVKELELFNQLIIRLQRNEPIGINTGRSLDFMLKEILIPLESKIIDQKLLYNIIAIGEKGAVLITYDHTGKRTKHIDNSISVGQSIQDEIKNLINHDRYSKTMFYDTTKCTMVSIEELPFNTRIGTHDDFKSAQINLINDLKDIIKKSSLQDILKIDPTRIATDVENIHVGKALGARKIVEILEQRDIKPQDFLCFGDSASDYEMYEELIRLGKQVQFVFVGGREQLSGKDLEGVIFTGRQVDKGTLEFLQNENIQ